MDSSWANFFNVQLILTAPAPPNYHHNKNKVFPVSKEILAEWAEENREAAVNFGDKFIGI